MTTFEENYFQIQQLAELLTPSKSDSDDEFKPKLASGKNVGLISSHFGPDSIGLPECNESETREISKNKNGIIEESVLNGHDDKRQKPSYDILYKQQVTTEDVYLQMGNKGPSSVSCEDMVIRIHLPGTQSIEEIKLDVTKSFVNCSTKTFRLGLHLPHQVDPQAGRAEWNGCKEKLVISLRLVRPFDELNF
ncbi:protein PIH1D3-like [Limulus polyphemus]|uniref:Protein PIH1D3-like n=1 Tax=Limulus polyphemus TaxID=6850 RepID=A0ABM1TBX7_LIMPO|nr:protein PIH1D3-like [Limulus polyphemus]